MLIGDRLRELRLSLGMSQTDFGEKCGVTKKTQIFYESNKRKPKADYWEAAALLGININYVLTGKVISDSENIKKEQIKVSILKILKEAISEMEDDLMDLYTAIDNTMEEFEGALFKCGISKNNILDKTIEGQTRLLKRGINQVFKKIDKATDQVEDLFEYSKEEAIPLFESNNLAAEAVNRLSNPKISQKVKGDNNKVSVGDINSDK